jgi:thiol:disulfide interchange protein DsbD
MVGAVDEPAKPAGPGGNGLLAFLWLSILSGFGALLTPCVFPMIPITVSYFIKRKDQNRSRLAGPAAYCLGIIGTFTCVGVVTAALFGASTIQRFANHPITNIVLAILFLVMAANLFGVFEIVLPSSLVNKASSGSSKGGLVGPFMMGLTFALTTFTCTVAFVGTLLVTAAQGQYFYPIVGMAAFSAAFALPFFFLALFPSQLDKLPKSGSWMVSVKAFMGFLEIAAALKFLSNADLALSKAWLTKPVFLAIWAAVFVVAGLYLLGWLRLPHDAEGQKLGWPRRALGVATALLGVWLITGINGQPLGELQSYIPPDPYPGQESKVGGTTPFLHKLSWAQAIAKAENRPIFINFTGANCTNCRQMEQHVLPRPDVEKELANFIPLELYTDRQTPEDNANQKYQQELAGAVTLPLYVVVGPGGQVLKKFDQGFTRNPAEFVDFLKAARSSSTQLASR